MKVALVGPKWNKLVNSYPSLGLAYIAAIFEQEGHEVKLAGYIQYRRNVPFSQLTRHYSWRIRQTWARLRGGLLQ